MSTDDPRRRNLLPPWASGQTGNPRGGSQKVRDRKRARQWIETLSEESIPDDLLTQLRATSPVFADLLPKGVTFGFAEALRLHIIAIMGKPSETLAAMAILDQIIPAHRAPPEQLEPPLLPTTEERRRAMAAELGIELGPADDDSIN
jgi:hypothetical protein